MNVTEPYRPSWVGSLSVTSASAQLTLGSTGSTCKIRNYGPNRARIRFGRAGVTALTTDYPIEAYTEETLSRDMNLDDVLAAICQNSGETSTLSVSVGFGQ